MIYVTTISAMQSYFGWSTDPTKPVF